MKATPTKIPDVFVIEPRVFGDERGFFFESFNEKAFNAATGNSLPFVQDNHSRSVKGVLRGLHYQLPPKAQGKLVRVVQGEVFDVAVDIRKDSPTYGQWVAEVLSADNKKQLANIPARVLRDTELSAGVAGLFRASMLKQGFVAARFHDFSVLHHVNAMCLPRCSQAVRNEQYSSTSRQGPKTLHPVRVRPGVHGASWFVKNQNRRWSDKGTRKCNALRFTAT
mgnify:CR=1 FL=1